MRLGNLARNLLRIAAALAVAAAFTALDWYPAVRDLGRLRREQSELKRRIRDYGAMAGKFEFPDEREKALLAGAGAELCRALPAVDGDDTWTAIGLLDLQNRIGEDRLPHARFMGNGPLWGTELGAAGPGPPDPLNDWLRSWRFPEVRDGSGITAGPGRFPWHGVLSGLEPCCERRLASRHVAAALAAPLPKLLDFINHVSWGDARLEIVRLHLEPGVPLARAWLVLRGQYRVRAPSPWEVPEGAGGGDGLRVDPDSPLLWRRIDPAVFSGGERTKLPAASAR